MASIRLWTFQREPVAEFLVQKSSYHASWERTPANWRKAYRWMAKCLRERNRKVSDGAPVWCWHSCNGQPGGPPTVWTARALLSDYDYEQGIVMLTMSVPEELALLSSYWAWNEFLDYVIVNGALPRSRRWRPRMFQAPLFKHDTDDVQAVIPFIRPEWIERIAKVNIAGRKDDESL